MLNATFVYRLIHPFAVKQSVSIPADLAALAASGQITQDKYIIYHCGQCGR